MEFTTENYWYYDQNQCAINDEMFLDLKTPDNYSQVSHTVWSSDHNYARDSERVQNSVPLQTNSICDDNLSHQSPVQYAPLTPDPVPTPVFYAPIQKNNCNFMTRRHFAQITFAPTRNGNFKPIVKRKRKRTVFKTEQIESLEDIFKTKQYITREERQVIASQLQLNDKAVKIWFQNRRLKDKKGPEQTGEEHGTITFMEARNAQDIARLEYVESLINKKTDEYGYVTLDDNVMKNLYGVINDFLLSDQSDVANDDPTESDSSPIYEPISPASISDSNDEDNASSWKPSEPNESLQRLFDLQSMLSL